MPPKRAAPITATQGPSQRRRQPVASDDSSDDDEASFAGEEAGGSTQAAEKGGLNETTLKQKAAQLVRMALFFEYRRNPIKRGDIVRLVIPTQPRAFNVVLERAQKVLKQTFGMDLVELRGKHKASEPAVDGETHATETQKKTKGKERPQRNGDTSEPSGEDEDAGVDAGNKRKKSTGTKSYILRSTLPPDLVATLANPAPLPMFDADGDEAGDRDEDGDVPADSGALVRWEKGDGTASGNVGLLGVRTVVLCLVMCLGRVIQDDHLHALLRRLDLQRDTILPYSSRDSKEQPMTLDKYLDLLDKQHYLEKIKIAGPNGVNGEGATVEWRWGSREAEFSEKAAAAFIEKIFINDADESESEEEPQPTRRGRAAPARRDPAAEKAKARKELREDIAKAAGGPLMGSE